VQVPATVSFVDIIHQELVVELSDGTKKPTLSIQFGWASKWVMACTKE
jgi:hypothetical protein